MLDDATVSPAAPKPAHVPDHLIYDFDMFLDPAYVANPHARLLELHHVAPPVFWTPRQGGHWVLIGHEANFHASRDWDSFTSQFSNPEQFQKLMAQLPKDIGHIPTAVPINLDPPAHGIYRAPLNGVFYRAPAPGADPFVEIGDRVEVGQTLCILEAMKLMNEIESDESGEVIRIFVENGQPVEYGQKLFGVRV